MSALLTSPAHWSRSASCVGMAGRDRDPWAPCDDLPAESRDFEYHLGRRICSTCPVRLDCVLEALDNLPVVGQDAMRGGLRPEELVELARTLRRPWRREAQHGTRSRYVAGCKCDDCRAAHRVYEHERRLQKPRQQSGSPPVSTPRAMVSRRLSSSNPRTARAIARATGLKTWRVRLILAALLAEGKATEVGASVGKTQAPTFVRTTPPAKADPLPTTSEEAAW